MTRRKLPAYAAGLLERRRRGDHPLCVHIIYGFKWNVRAKCTFAAAIPGEHPVLAVKPSDYAPDRYDFGVLSGLRVLLADQEGAIGDVDDPDAGPVQPARINVWWLLSEIAVYSAEIEIVSPVIERSRTADDIAFCMRHGDAAVNNGWPWWWSASINEKNAKRTATWFRAVGELAERRSAVCA